MAYVYRSPAYITPSPVWYESSSLYDMALALSASSSYNIIDSWTACATADTITGRYKGDPITGSQWTSTSSLLQGAGMVVEQANPRSGYPAFQFKLQATGSNNYYDVSGSTASYKYEGDALFRNLSLRFNALGGWDLEDTAPDFATPTAGSDNRKITLGAFGGSATHRVYWVWDDDYLICFESEGYDATFYHIGYWFGQYNTKTDYQESVTAPAYMFISSDNAERVDPDYGDASGEKRFLSEFPGGAWLMVGCLDEDEDWQDWDLSMSAMDEFLQTHVGGNEFDPDPQTVELFECLVAGHPGGSISGPDRRMIGSLRGVYRGTRIGDGALTDDKQYLCLGTSYGVIVEWDGSTSV